MDKAYLKRVLLYVLAFVLAIGLALYIGYHIYKMLSREIATTPALLEDFKITATCDAYIFRDETALTCAYGTPVPTVRDGEKVPKAAVVANTYSTVSENKLSDLDTVRSQIHLLSAKTLHGGGGDLGISDTMTELAALVKNGDLTGAGELATRLSVLSAARRDKGGDAEAVLESLETREKELIDSLGMKTGEVTAPESGWYYSKCDGYENIFTVAATDNLTPSRLDELTAANPASTAGGAGRIVRTYKWYAAVQTDIPSAEKLESRGYVECALPGTADEATLVVESMIKDNDRAVTVFSCGIIPEGADMGRRLSLDLTLDEVTGIRVPKSAVRVIDGQTGVYTFNGVLVQFRLIDVGAEYDDCYVALVHDELPTAETTDEETEEEEYTPYLAVNELIITEGRDLYDGKIIG